MHIWHAAGWPSAPNLRPLLRSTFAREKLHTDAYEFDILAGIGFGQLSLVKINIIYLHIVAFLVSVISHFCILSK